MANRMIEEIHGIGVKPATRLRNLGISHTDELLQAARTREGRANLSDLTTIPEAKLLRWVQTIELCRVDGIEPEAAELLETAGVGSLRELRDQKAAELAARCEAANARRKITLSSPSAQTLQDWIARAARLPAVVET